MKAQLEFRFGNNHGGRRKGSGAKARRRADGTRQFVGHGTREEFDERYPVHVTLRVRAGLPSLRGEELSQVVLRVLEAGNERDGFRLVHFCVVSNHLHLICEASGAAALSAALKGHGVRLARAINKRLGCTGRVIEDRSHWHVLRTLSEVRNALAYVLRNGEWHGMHHGRSATGLACPDPMSSAAWFGEWVEQELELAAQQAPASVVRAAQSHLLTKALRYAAPLSLLAPSATSRGRGGKRQRRMSADSSARRAAAG